MRVEQYWSHSFIPSLIRRGGIAFDIGVNSGGFARLIADRCTRVIGFEPDPVWQGKLNLPHNVEVIAKAIAGTPGKLRFNVNSEKCSSLHYADIDASTVEVDSITLEQALELVPDGRIDLIKMDIEGEELAVLSDAPAELFDRVAQMTIEFHDFMDPDSLPRVKAVIERLQELGFYTFCFSWRSHGDLLFINRNIIPLSFVRRLWIFLRYKYLRGVMRIMRRKLGLSA